MQRRLIPDAINATPPNPFTMIPNTIINDPNLTFKAKGILAILLSNRDGWKIPLPSRPADRSERC